MPDIKTFSEKLETIFSGLNADFSVFSTLSSKELTEAANGGFVVEGATEEDINNLKAAIAQATNVVMSYRQAIKLERLQAYTSRVNGLGGEEWVPCATFQHATNAVGRNSVAFMPGNYVVSNPSLWTTLGAYYNSQQTTPFGVVGHATSQSKNKIVNTEYGEEIVTSETLTSISSVANHYGWDPYATRLANAGRGIPLNSEFGKDCIIFPPFYREPKSSFYNGGMEHFMAPFDHKKGRKYFSAISSAPVLQMEKVFLGLYSTCKWINETDDFDTDEWKPVHTHQGKVLLCWNLDGTHYQNEACWNLFNKNHYVQFRTFEKSTISAIVESNRKWDENYLLSHEANANLRILTGFVNNPESDFWIDAVDSIEIADGIDIDDLLDNLLDNPHLYQGWNNSAACGRKSIQGGAVVTIPGVLETYYNALTPIIESVDPNSYLVKGIAEKPNFKETTWKSGGDTPMIWAWFPEIKGEFSHLHNLAIEEALRHLGSNGNFEVLVKTSEELHCSAINFPGVGEGSFGYQQTDCLASEKTLAPESLKRVKTRLKELEAFEIKGVDLPVDGSIQQWVSTLIHLEFETLFKCDLAGGNGWHEAIVKRLKNDSLNGALMAAFGGELWLETENGRKAYEETREAMADLVFKGAGIKTIYAVMSPPTPYRAEKLKSQDLTCGLLPIPSFWEKKGHGTVVDCVVTRSPVVSMDNPYYGRGKMSKHAKGHICPQWLAFGPLVGDFDGDTSSTCVYTPKTIFDQLKRRNKVVALAHNIVTVLASEPRIDRISFAVEEVPKDKAFKSRPLVRNGTFNWNNVSIEGEQGQMGIYAFAFSHALATGLVTPNLISTQCRYQSAIDLQGSITVSAWRADANDIIVEDGKVSISDDGWTKAQTFDIDDIQRVLLKDASKSMSLSNPHWEIAIPPFLKQELQVWARNNTFDDMKFFCFTGSSVGDLIVHKSVLLGWRNQWAAKDGSVVTMTGPGLREINPNSVSLPITNRWLELEKGLKKGNKIRDLAWINSDKSYFGNFDHIVGEYSATHYVWNAVRATTKDQKLPKAGLFWCPTSEIDDEVLNSTLSKLDEVVLKDVKVNAYTVFLNKKTCEVIASNFLQFVPHFLWDTDEGLLDKFLGATQISEEEILKIYERATKEDFWKANQIFDWEPKWLQSAIESLDDLEENSQEYLEEQAKLVERADKAWQRLVRYIQRLFEMVAVNASTDFCSKWVDIVKDYDSTQSNELYTALVLAHPGVKGLQCPCCRKAFHRHSSSDGLDEPAQIFSELHKFLIKIDKNIDSMILSDEAHPTLVELQAKRKLRFDEAKGKGVVEGFALTKIDQIKANRKSRDEILRLPRTYRRDISK